MTDVGMGMNEEIDVFVVDLYLVMGQIVTDYEPWLRDEVREPFRRAYYDTEDAYNQTREWLQTEEAESALARVGLKGPQGDLKFLGYQSARERFVERPTRWFMRRVLSWGNIILGSLSSAFPPAEVLKELKEALEVELEEREDEESG